MRQRSVALFAILLVLTLSPRPASAQARQYVDPVMASDTATLPFSEAVRVGNTLYLSGTIGLLPGPKVPDTAAEEARLVLENVKAVR